MFIREHSWQLYLPFQKTETTQYQKQVNRRTNRAHSYGGMLLSSHLEWTKATGSKVDDCEVTMLREASMKVYTLTYNPMGIKL